MKLYPAILTDSPKILAIQLEISKQIEDVEVAQIDVIDGQMADNLTITPVDIVGFELEDLQLDFHLMVREPINYLDEIIVNREYLSPRAVVAQIEQMSSQSEYLEKCRANQLQAGLSLDLFTPLEEMDFRLLDQIDVIQLMGVEIGFQGQSFHSHALEKVKELLSLRQENGYHYEIMVDGGVKADNIDVIHQSGVDAVAIGSWLWKNDNPREVAKIVVEKEVKGV